LRWRQE